MLHRPACTVPQFASGKLSVDARLSLQRVGHPEGWQDQQTHQGKEGGLARLSTLE
jgi:hypothetical protein